jgi:hypothetical protein
MERHGPLRGAHICDYSRVLARRTSPKARAHGCSWARCMQVTAGRVRDRRYLSEPVYLCAKACWRPSRRTRSSLWRRGCGSACRMSVLAALNSTLIGALRTEAPDAH